MTITSKEGLEPGTTIVCFVVHKTTSEQEYTILTTLYLAGAKNTDMILFIREILASIQVLHWDMLFKHSQTLLQLGDMEYIVHI
jgi:hypothetical protein